MDWPIRIEPFLLLIIVSGTLLLAAGIAGLMRSRRRERGGPSKDLRIMIQDYGNQNAEFARIMQGFLEDRELCSALLKREDIQALLDDFNLQTTKRLEKRRRESRSTLLDLPGQGEGGEHGGEAGMVTILRAIYLDEDLQSALPKGAEQDLDKLLDSLTV